MCQKQTLKFAVLLNKGIGLIISSDHCQAHQQAFIHLCETSRDAGPANGESFSCVVERSLVRNQAESPVHALIVLSMNNELPAPLSSRRRKTLRNETARWEYEIVACVSACAARCLCACLCSRRVRAPPIHGGHRRVLPSS